MKAGQARDRLASSDKKSQLTTMELTEALHVLNAIDAKQRAALVGCKAMKPQRTHRTREFIDDECTIENVRNHYERTWLGSEVDVQ